MRYDSLITPHLDRLVGFRRDLHAHPELGFEEVRTAAKVLELLEPLGYTIRRAGKTGVVADLAPAKGAPKLALRADMDGLPMQEETGLSHQSTVAGRMHACGHDGHTATLAGTALALAACRDRIPGNVRLLFQPAEEGLGGGKALADEGALDGVGQVFGMHNWPNLPLGHVATCTGPIMATSAKFHVVLEGKGGHGSQPQDAVDPVYMAGLFIVQAQGLIARENHPLHPAVVSVCTVHGGTATNIIPDRVELSGTVRTFEDEQAEHLGARLRELAEGLAAVQGGRATFSWDRYYPVTVNHAEPTARVERAARELFGKDRVTKADLPLLGAEDFSFLAQKVPGCYFFLGTGKPDTPLFGCHSSRFDFNDEALPLGISMYLRLVEETYGAPLV
jgi:amidohydrolase